MPKYTTSKQVQTGRWSEKDAEAYRKGSATRVEKLTRTPEEALQYLVELGTHKPRGGLTAKYGGRTTKSKT